MIEQSRCCCMHDMDIIVRGPSCVMLGGPSSLKCRPPAYICDDVIRHLDIKKMEAGL